MPAPAVKILPAVFNNSPTPYYTSYTLSCTPFYFTTVWDTVSSQRSFSQYQIVWDFGDGTTYVGPSAEHFYKYPGTYYVAATFYDINGAAWTVNRSTDGSVISLTAINAMPDTIIFESLLATDRIGVYILPAGERSKPLSIIRYNSWQNDGYLANNNYTVNLYASGSKSDYLSPVTYYSNKWSHLKNYFGFVEVSYSGGILDTKLVDNTTTSSVSVYAERYKDPLSEQVQLRFYNYPVPGTSFAGTSGTVNSNNKTVHFVDQSPTLVQPESLVFLFASPDTRSFPDKDIIENNFYSNISQPFAGFINTPWKVQYYKSAFNPAQSLAITSNGITAEGEEEVKGPLSAQLVHSFGIYPVKWANTKIPFVITLKDANNFTTKCYPPLTGFRYDGQDPTELNTVSVGVYQYVDPSPFALAASLSTIRVAQAQFIQNSDVPVYKNSGGYFAGAVTVPDQTLTVVICAAALIQDKPVLNLNTTYGFVSQPGQKTLKRIAKRPIFSNCEKDTIEVTYAEDIETYNTSTSGLVAISIAPRRTYNSGPIDRVYAADSDEDKIFVYTLSGDLVAALSLSGIPVKASDTLIPITLDLRGNLDSASPSNIATDRYGNAWITLYDAITTIKIDSESLIVTASAVPNLQNFEYTNPSLYVTLRDKLSGFVGENSLLPACVDTDVDSNLWVAYNHPVSGFIIKYSSSGVLLSAYPFPSSSSIQELLIDKDNNMWAVAIDLTGESSQVSTRNDILYRWDKDFNLSNGFPINNIGALGNISIDFNQNAWLGNKQSNIIRVTPTGEVVRFDVGQLTDYEYSNIDFTQQLGGIATDAEGYLWVLHNLRGKVFYYPILPTATQVPLSALFTGNLPDIELINVDGSQAFYSVIGDWTGSRWVNKYYNTYQPDPKIVRGQSNLFDIFADRPIINKINENFDLPGALQSYSLQESLMDKPVLFNEFIGQILGNETSDPDNIGKLIYEKISNYVNNITDLETCNLRSLRSMFDQLGVSYSDFYSSAPPKLRRILDILSIKQTKLFGSKNLFTENFGLSSQGYGIGTNTGNLIPIATGRFIIGAPIIAFEKFSGQYKLIRNTIVPETNGIPVILGNAYPLSCVNYYWGWGLVTGTKAQSGVEIQNYYDFFEYIPNYANNTVDSIIDFDNPLTTIVPTESSYDTWTKYAGTIDKIVSHTFYEGLEILK